MTSADFYRPVVSVVVPVFNRLSLLEETLSSLEAQTLRGAEFLLVDDRSGLETIAHLEEVCRRDPRFRLLRKPDGVLQGCQASRNLGLEASRAPFLMFLDSDDLLAPTCLEERCAFLDTHTEADVAVGRQAILDERNGQCCWVNQQRPGVCDLDRFLCLGDPLDVPWVNGGCLLRTNRLRASGIQWRDEFPWDDVAFHFEVLLAGLSPQWMPAAPSPDAIYRLHGGDHFGEAIHSAHGIERTLAMLEWMTWGLRGRGLLTEDRLARLARSWFHLCILKLLDAGDWGGAAEAVSRGLDTGLFSVRRFRCLQRYARGRRLLRSSPRLTYHWNQFARRKLLEDFFCPHLGTYRKLRV